MGATVRHSRSIRMMQEQMPSLTLLITLSCLLLPTSSLPAIGYPREAPPPNAPRISYDPVPAAQAPAPAPAYEPLPAAPAEPRASSYPAPAHKEPGMPYSYSWEVNDSQAGLEYGQSESSDGSVVSGEYRVLLPDGRTQVVRYSSDHVAGYVAEVTYEGEARPYVAPPKPSYPAL